MDGIPRRELFDVWRTEPNMSRRVDCVCNYVMMKSSLEDVAGHMQDQIQQKCAELCKKLKARWTKCNYILKQFLKKNGYWLNVKMTQPRRS